MTEESSPAHRGQEETAPPTYSELRAERQTKKNEMNRDDDWDSERIHLEYLLLDDDPTA